MIEKKKEEDKALQEKVLKLRKNLSEGLKASIRRRTLNIED